MVSADALHAVLVDSAAEDSVVQFELTRSHGADGEDSAYSDFETSPPGFDDEPEDVTIQFGDEGDSGGMFLESEFEGSPEETPEATPASSSTFQAQLNELLQECKKRGYEDPEIAFCTTVDEIDEVELRLPVEESTEEEEGEFGLSLPASRDTLLEMLEEQYEGGVDEERVGFIPMHNTEDGRQRALALIARPGGGVLSTLSAAQDQTFARPPQAQVLDTEVSLYLGLARHELELPPNTSEKTIVVRVGASDTLVLFMEGNTLRQAEHLPELTTEDPAETICSRVLLLQDEYGMGDMDHFLLVAEEEEDVLRDAFRSYFAEANPRLLHTRLQEEDRDSGTYVAATEVALRLLDDSEYGAAYPSLNLLPDGYTKRRFRLPVEWSVPALLVLLGLITVGFVWYYLWNASAISEREAELQTLEQQIEQVDRAALEGELDSLQAQVAEYSEGLDVVDELLVGSDKWSQGLATVTDEMDAVRGLSLEDWRPQGEMSIAVTGRTTARNRVVDLARRLDSEIVSLRFTEIRDMPLYDFEMTVPLDSAKPEAATYWREERIAEAEEAAETTEEDITLADASAAVSGETAQTAAEDETVNEESVPTDQASGADNDPEASESRTGEEGTWTVVVASMESESNAREVASEKRQASDVDHSVQIRKNADSERYRVSLGTFSSLEGGQAALEELRDLLHDGIWLHRFSDAEDESVISAAEIAQDASGE